MKNHISSLFRLAIVSLAAFPAFALAAPALNTPYYNDVTNSYVQDQTSQVMADLNGILCYMGAMAPNLMVNGGNYIALIDQNVCEAKGSGGQSGNTGPAYTSAIVNSTRASTADPMLVKVWVSPQPNNNITVYASATQAPNTTTLPYGVFRMDYCGGSTCANDKGYIDASSAGLSFYSAYADPSPTPTYSATTALKLNATGSGTTAAGSGAISQSFMWNGTSGVSNFKFAYNANHFVRNDGIDPTATGDKCFDRNPANAAESVWRYGLYDATTGAQITRKSGFPVEYTTAGGVTYNGYVGYYGLWMPVTVPSGSTVNKVNYSNNAATKVPYTLYSTGGKLTKYTTANKTLAALNKITFWYFVAPNVNIPATGTPAMSGGTTGAQYELFWDDLTSQFMVSGKQGTTGNMEPFPTPVPIVAGSAASNSAMVTASPWGLFGWSQMMGGQFGINSTEFAKLNSIPASLTSANMNVITQKQDIIYPADFATKLPSGLTCINNCPDSTGTMTNPGWSQVPSTALVPYSLNGTTGNMFGTGGAVTNTTTTFSSGRLFSTADKTALDTAKGCTGACTTYFEGDVSLLPAYYVWETGPNPWNQISYLMSQAATPVLEVFDAPLQVSYTVPANNASTSLPYGNFAGSTMTLQYGGFGDLWGIPNECVDITTNFTCDFTVASPKYNNFRWTSKFSIPFDATKGIVTVPTTQGTVTAGTQYLVKPLDKEVRLANVSCSATTLLATSTLTAVTLPTAAGFVDPTPSAGTKPVLNPVPAPQVIHGVKQY